MPHSSGNKDSFSWMLNTLHRGVPSVHFFGQVEELRAGVRTSYIVMSSDKPFLSMNWIKYHKHYIFTTLYTVPSWPIRSFGSWIDDREPSDCLVPLKYEPAQLQDDLKSFLSETEVCNFSSKLKHKRKACLECVASPVFRPQHSWQWSGPADQSHNMKEDVILWKELNV